MNETIINLNDYEPSGAGALGESYISKSNPNILLKLYSREREQMGLDEYERACKVYQIGVPCPTPGELVRTEEGLLGIQFHRIVGKKSYARALSEHPERLEAYAARIEEVEAMLEPYNTLRSLALEQSLNKYRPEIRPALREMIETSSNEKKH